ncbi:MAG TPA: NUDIX hydrolase [Bacillota bacterium]|nr:NUDIX hydrolase [Bacillota bacterium]
MKKLYGAAAVCMNEKGDILMVKQGTPEEEKKWSVPSGIKEEGETFEQCCIREVKEETGYDIKIIRKLKVKKFNYSHISVRIHYFEVEVVDGKRVIQDPDDLIYEIKWQSPQMIQQLKLSYPEDRQFLLDYINNIYS